jgi:ketosteroid isomerase-like protein
LNVVQQAIEAISSGDRRKAEELFDPNAEWHNTSAFPGERVWTGPQAIIAFWQMLIEDFSEEGMEIERHLERERWVVVGLHSWGQGKASGAPVDVRWAAIFELHEKRLTRVDVYGDYAKAVEAAASRA